MKYDKENKKEFGQRLKQARKSCKDTDGSKMTQAKLAKILGTSQVELSWYENGVRKPLPERMSQIASALNVDEYWLDIGQGEYDLEDTPYGKHIDLKYVNDKSLKDVQLTNNYNKLNNNDKQIVNELINLLSKH